MGDFKKWCRLVATRDEGKVTLSNIYHDCKRGRVRPETLKVFFRRLIAIVDDTDPDSERQLDRVRELIETCDKEFSCEAIDKAASARCSHFIPDFWLIADNTDGLRMGWPITDVVSDSHIREIAAGRARWGTIPPKGYARAWVTRTEESDTVPRDEKASKVLRQKLGLLKFIHLGRGYLLEIRYPENAVDPLRPPTFLDGSTFVVYRSKSGRESWGAAVDLGDPEYGDGFSEAVHAPVPFTEKFVVRSAGRMEYMELDPDPAKLFAQMPDPWRDDLDDELEQFFK